MYLTSNIYIKWEALIVYIFCIITDHILMPLSSYYWIAGCSSPLDILQNSKNCSIQLSDKNLPACNWFSCTNILCLCTNQIETSPPPSPWAYPGNLTLSWLWVSQSIFFTMVVDSAFCMNSEEKQLWFCTLCIYTFIIYPWGSVHFSTWEQGI